MRQFSLAVGAAILLALVSAAPLCAQTVNNAFGGLSKSSNDPIDIESDVLTVYDGKKKATFQGNVKAVQGTTTLRAAELDVYYVGGTEKFTGQEAEAVPVADKAAKPDKKDGPDAQINKIEARGSVVITTSDEQTTTSDWAIYDVRADLVTVGGNVVITTSDEQATTSDWAIYDVRADLVTVGGNVVLSQGQNVLKGDKLIIDLKTGESRFESTGNSTAGGRIRALFMPDQEGGVSTTEPAGANPKKKPGASTAASDGQAAPAGAVPAQDKQTPVKPLPIMPEFR